MKKLVLRSIALIAVGVLFALPTATLASNVTVNVDGYYGGYPSINQYGGGNIFGGFGYGTYGSYGYGASQAQLYQPLYGVPYGQIGGCGGYTNIPCYGGGYGGYGGYYGVNQYMYHPSNVFGGYYNPRYF
jgi:hypothetical protein